MMRWWFVLFICPPLSAATLEQVYVRRLSHASKNEVEALQSRFERIRMLRLACSLQIKEKQVPASCYEAMNEEARWGLRTSAQTRLLVSDLDERCTRAAGALVLPPPAQELVSLSPGCARAVSEARRIQAYRQGGKTWSEN